FKILKIFSESKTLSKDQILTKIKKIFNEYDSNQDEITILKNYIPMFKALGIIDDEFNLIESFGKKLVNNEDLKVKQFIFLNELFHRKWFVYSFFNYYKIISNNKDKISKKNLLNELNKILNKNGFYIRRKNSNQKNSPNYKRIDAFWNLIYYLGLINRNGIINEQFLVKFEEYLRNKIARDKDPRKSMKNFIINLSKIITESEEKEIFENVSEMSMEEFYNKVILIYKKFSEKYVFIDDLAKHFDDENNFFDKLWLLQEEGRAFLVPSRKLQEHKTYSKYGRRYSKILIYK
ncbi:MAG: hypothetical protein ACTSVV_08865, partial [Promethearchaeota archaeon]